MSTPDCKDCKHNRPHWLFGHEFAKCAATEPMPWGKHCSSDVERMFENGCGPAGKNFEQKPRPRWAFWRKN